MYKIPEKKTPVIDLGEKLLSFGHHLPTITNEIAYQVHGFTTVFIKSICQSY
jgi:hypothetical protein